MKIRQKLILLLVIVGLVPVLALSVIAYIAISRNITDKTLGQLSSVAGKQTDKISQILGDMRFEAVRVSNTFAINDAVSRYLEAKQKSSAQDAIVTSLREYANTAPDVDDVDIADKSGTIIGSTARDDLGKHLDSSQLVVAGGDITISLERDASDNTDKIYVRLPYTLGTTQVGTIIAKMRLMNIAAVTQDYSSLGDTGETILSRQDASGNAISLFALRFAPNAAGTTNLNSLHLAQHTTATYDQATDYRHNQVLVASNFIPATSWGLATKIDKSEALAPVAALLNTVIVIFAVTVIGLTILSLILAQRVTAPIVAITAKAREISAGSLHQRLPLSSRDEIGTLATAFNTMTDRLAESYGALEQKVIERTTTLDQKMRELAAAKAKDDAILDSMGEGLIVTDGNGVILLINEIAAQLLGRERLDLQNTPIGDIVLFDEQDKPLQTSDTPTQIALGTGQKTVQEVKAMHTIDGKISLNIIATPVVQASQTIGVIQIIRDITKEKEVDRMKTEFISLASHQLRTPLSAIKWFTEMLIAGDAGPLNKDQLDYEHNVADSTQRMIDLVSSLLNISRIESGRIIIDPEPTDLQELVSGIVNDLKAKIEERQQHLAISIHKELPKVDLDQRLIGQVFLNLLTNAIKYTPKGGEIDVFVSRKDDQLVTQVTDNGYGIPAAQQDKVFQRFFRAENAVKVETDGTGLGLYLIKAIIESSGGKIWFKSKEGEGTTFWFSLPMSGMKAKEGEVTIGD